MDLSIEVSRSDLETVMVGQKSFAASIEDGTARAEGDVEVLSKIADTLVNFQIGFEILPGTTGRSPEVDLNPYEVADGALLIHAE